MELRDALGLPITSDGFKLTYNESEVTSKNLIPFYLKDVAKVFPSNEKQDNNVEIYRVYENVRNVHEKEAWAGFDFDLIVLHPGMLSNVYNKTLGYYRSFAENGFRYPEVIQVADGYIELFLQKPSEMHTRIMDAVLIRAQKYDLISIPPAYGVTIINPSEKVSIVSRIRSSEVEEDKESYFSTKGECYYRHAEGRWDYNANYEEIPPLRLGEPQNKWKPFKRGTPIYLSFIYNPKVKNDLTVPDPVQFIL